MIACSAARKRIGHVGAGDARVSEREHPGVVDVHGHGLGRTPGDGPVLAQQHLTSAGGLADPLDIADALAAFWAVPLVHRGELPSPGPQGARHHNGAETTIEEEPQIAEVCGWHRHCAQAASGAISCGSSR